MKSKLLISLVGLIFVFSLSGGVWYWWNTSLTSPTGPPQSVSFVVKPGETATSVISRLKEKQLIRSEVVTKVYLKFFQSGKSIKSGAYLLEGQLKLPKVIDILTSGPKDIWVTIPEGWRREQVAARLQNNLLDFDGSEFVRLTAPYEGQLFPDTYLIPTQASPSAVLKIFLTNFTKKTALDLHVSANYEALILASLIEREAKADSERPVIAGILKKRLLANWPLQIDATVQYAADSAACPISELSTCDWWKSILNTKYPSPFNTYLHPGLPPAPISNPGLTSISASLAPEDSPYWYYLHDDQGIIHYATSLDGHNLNIDKYLIR